MSYNVSDYNDRELWTLLGFSTQPTDRELEAKIIQQIKNYQSIYKTFKTSDSLKLAQFFQDIYTHFFDVSESDFTDTGILDLKTSHYDTNIDNTLRNQTKGNIVSTDVVKKDNEIQLTQAVTYTSGTLNPILKETYTRTISIDSQYRDYTYSSSTDFTFNFTETLKDVVSLKLYAIQIPNTWYTISSKFGSNYFFLKPITTNYGIIGHNYRISVEPGNYTSQTLTTALTQSISQLSTIYTDVSFGSTSISYSNITCKATFTIDLQKTYNESYYKMVMSSNLSSILGLNRTTLWTIHSETFTDLTETNQIINSTNNRITLERYISDISNHQIQNTGTTFETIYIDLSNGSYTPTNLIIHINNQLQNHPKLQDSSVSLQTTTTNFWEWKWKLNRFTTIPSDMNSKLRVIIPNYTPWYGSGSFFAFPKLINEVNIMYSIPTISSITLNETIAFIPIYDICGGVYIDPIYQENQMENNIIISISGQYDTISSLISDINFSFQQNEYTYGSFFNYTNNLLQFIYNINKVYTTKDYKLVFYDVESFQKCSSGSFKNAKIDNTLGWILGFRTMVEYPLASSSILLVDSVSYFLNIDTYLSTGSLYSFQDLHTITTQKTIISLTGDTVVSVYLFNYLMIILDDYNQNHLNDGLVTISRRDNSVTLPSYANRNQYHCDPITGEKIYNTTIATTQNQYYSVQQIIQTQNINTGTRTSGPFIKDMFAMLPVKIGEPGTIYTEFGGTLQAQERLYFGPVNINRMSIQLINDKGDTLDLNGANWSIQLICEQLYQRH